mmetsp:Transcript_39684/g.124424  ORF Transcript_39684/g.124424 Transcript_39684/m.124424 type:complete len:287 (-) Transcript_39684:170-1030(-)
MASTPPPIRLTRSASYLGPLVTGPAAAEIIASGRREVVTLSDRHLTLMLETRESAKSLVPMPLEGVDELERMLLEAFVDDDYDGRLRLLTATGPFDELLGLIFWRDVPSEEMRSWLHPALVDAKGCIAPPPPLQPPVAAAQPARIGHADLPPTSALATPGPNALAAAAAPPLLGAAAPPAPVVTAGSWTKIELLGTDRSVRGDGLARLLLAYALAHAAALEGKTSAVLQIAGGEQNAAASRLYEGFGFVEAPVGAFQQPNDHLQVVWDIAQRLRDLCAARRRRCSN